MKGNDPPPSRTVRLHQVMQALSTRTEKARQRSKNKLKRQRQKGIKYLGNKQGEMVRGRIMGVWQTWSVKKRDDAEPWEGPA